MSNTHVFPLTFCFIVHAVIYDPLLENHLPLEQLLLRDNNHVVMF